MPRSREVRSAVAIGVYGLVVVALLMTSGCVKVPIDRESEALMSASPSVGIEDVRRAEVEISMGAGELFIGGGAGSGNLMDADFEYQPESWVPEVTYEVRGERGVLAVKQPRVSGFPRFREVKNEWDVRLSDELPLELEANLGAGTSELLLGGLDLRELRVAVGAGDVLVDLSGEWRNDLRASIQGGAGSFRVRVPSDVGVRVSGVRDGLGTFEIEGFTRRGEEYVNDAFGRSAVTIELQVSRGVGEVVIEQVD